MTEKVKVHYKGKTHYLRFLDKRDIMYKRIKKSHAFYELDVLEEIAKRNLSGVYLDLGANIGNHSTFFLHHTKCEYLFGVEAHPSILSVLHENIGGLNEGKVNYTNIAISDIDARGFVSDIDPANVGGTHMVNYSSGSSVRMSTIDNIMSTIDPYNEKDVTVIKMDIEGYEVKAVKGGLKTIERCKPLIIAELHTKEQYSQFQGLLEPLGYKEVGCFGFSPTYFWEII